MISVLTSKPTDATEDEERRCKDVANRRFVHETNREKGRRLIGEIGQQIEK